MHKVGFALFLCVHMAGMHAKAASDESAFLDELQQRGVRYFWEQANPATGLIYDRARFDASKHPHDRVASIAAVGFGLTAICIGQERGWIAPEDAYDRVLTTLRFLLNDMPHERGFYYHFVDIQTGERRWNSELSSIDTALLMAGVLTVRQYYKDTEIEELARKLYERVEWPRMMSDGRFLMGWKPEDGYLSYYWDNYSEHLILYLLAMGSPTHPIPADTWTRWRRAPVVNHGGRTFLACPPLFTHQYSQNWIDFRNKRDAYADYHLNTILATRAQRQMFLDLSGSYRAYGRDLWGLTASDSPNGYVAWGGPPETSWDGTITPYAAGGAVSFTPKDAIYTLRYMRDKHGDSIWGDYAFSVAFNPRTGWVADDVIGIDIGISVLAAENYRSEFVWDTFMRNPEIQRAMQRAGFYDLAHNLPETDQQYLRDLARDTWRSIEQLVDERSGLPHSDQSRSGATTATDIGLHLTALVAARELGLLEYDEALQRTQKALKSVAQINTLRGFPPDRIELERLAPARANWISTAGTGNYAAGLITAARAFPEMRNTIRPLLESLEWNAFLDKERNVLHGMYDLSAHVFRDEWTVSHLGEEGRMAAFLAIAFEHAPGTVWEQLNRETEERHHVHFLKPGWDGDGLTAAFMSGLWLDERGTLAHQSARNLAYAQMRHADLHGYPAWGWSVSASPRGGFIGRGRLHDHVVAPYASVLTLDHSPTTVVSNLRALERLGARHPEYGFYDAVNIRTGQCAQTFIHRHQSMILIALANYLEHHAVRFAFESDLRVLKGRERIREFRNLPFGGERSLFTLEPAPRDMRLLGL